MAINVVSTKAEMEKHGALPWGSHALQWMSPVFPQVSTEIDNFLLCLSLERFKKKGGGCFLGKEELVTKMLVVPRGHQSWAPGTWQVPSVCSRFILPRPRGAGARAICILQVSR